MNGYYTDQFINLILQNKDQLSSKEFIEQKILKCSLKFQVNQWISRKSEATNIEYAPWEQRHWFYNYGRQKSYHQFLELISNFWNN